jgi:hypothetical protein
LGRPFLVGAIIDMREGTIKYQFPLKKGMNTSLGRERNYYLTLFIEQIISLMLHRLILLDSHFLRLTQMRLRKALLGDNPMFYF